MSSDPWRGTALSLLHGRHAHRLTNARRLGCFLIVQSPGDSVARLLVLWSWEPSGCIFIILLLLTAALEVRFPPPPLTLSPLTPALSSLSPRAALLLEKPSGCNLYFAFHLRVVERHFTFPGRKKKKIHNCRQEPGFVEFAFAFSILNPRCDPRQR